MKMLLITGMVFLGIVFCGCQVSSMTVLENPEFPDAMIPVNMNPRLLEKYAVGQVIVHPRIHYADSTQTKYKLLAVFFSRTNTAIVSIKSITIRVNGEKVEYGKQLLSESISDWKLYPANKPFYACSISGDPIDRSKEAMLKKRVDVLLEILVEEESEITTKKIAAYFLPKKRSYLE